MSILFMIAATLATLCWIAVHQMRKGTYEYNQKLTAEQVAGLPQQIKNAGWFFTAIALISLLIILPVGFFDTPEQREHRKQNALYQQCIDQAMTSATKRTTAETAAAIQLERSDKQHLIKYVTTRDAVAAFYCLELKPKSLNK